MNIEIKRIMKEQKETFLNLYNLYLYDLSEFTLDDPINNGVFDPTFPYLFRKLQVLH